MPTSNSVFLTVRRAAAFDAIGWQVRVLSTDFSFVVADITEFVDLTVSTELNGPGAGSITLDADSPMWSRTLGDGRPATALKDLEYLWEAYEDGVLRVQWLGTNCDDTQVSEDGTRSVVISGPGAANVLSWARVFPPPGSPDPAVGVSWPFTVSTPAMEIFLYLLGAAQSRGAVPWVTPMFTTATDSGGQLWADVANPYTRLTQYLPELNSTLLDQLNNTTGQDLDTPVGLRAEWVMWPGFRLDVRPVIGTHREHEVVFYDAQMHANQRTHARDAIANVVVVRDAANDMSPAVDDASIAMFNRREYLDQRADLTDSGRRDAVAAIVLEQMKSEKSSWTISLPYRLVGRWAFRDFDLGDWIGISHHEPGGGNAVDAFRVMAISVQITADTEPVLELTLESVFEARQRELEKNMTKVINIIANNPILPLTGPGPVGGDTTTKPVIYDPAYPGGLRTTDWPSTGGGGSGLPPVIFSPTEPDLTACPVGYFWYQTT